MPINIYMNNIIDQSCIYTSADSLFFNTYGISFIKSFAHYNPTTLIHFHIIDPGDNDLKNLDQLPCKYSISYTDENLKLETVENLKKVLADNKDIHLIKGLKSAFRFSKDIPTVDKKLYKLVHGQNYRSGRFISLNKLWTGENTILCYDVDTLCTKPFNIENVLNDDQGCLDIKGKFVTSLTGFKNNSELLREWGRKLDYYISNKISFGFMDQNTFIECAKKYNTEHINRKYCNHSKGSAFVITGKGKKKFDNEFMKKVNEWKMK